MTHPEYAVIARDAGGSERFTNLGKTFPDADEARGFMDWLTGPRMDEIRELALAEQATADADPRGLGKTNQMRLGWEREQGVTYRIVVRHVTDWADA